MRREAKPQYPCFWGSELLYSLAVSRLEAQTEPRLCRSVPFSKMHFGVPKGFRGVPNMKVAPGIEGSSESLSLFTQMISFYCLLLTSYWNWELID